LSRQFGNYIGPDLDDEDASGSDEVGRFARRRLARPRLNFRLLVQDAEEEQSWGTEQKEEVTEEIGTRLDPDEVKKQVIRMGEHELARSRSLTDNAVRRGRVHKPRGCAC
jgi:hypothetical protein